MLKFINLLIYLNVLILSFTCRIQSFLHSFRRYLEGLLTTHQVKTGPEGSISLANYRSTRIYIYIHNLQIHSKTQVPTIETFWHVYANCFLEAGRKQASIIYTASPCVRVLKIIPNTIHNFFHKLFDCIFICYKNYYWQLLYNW